MKLVDLDVIFKHETDSAVLVAMEEDEEPVWLPRSQIEIDGWCERGHVIEVTMPQRLAEEKGLV